MARAVGRQSYSRKEGCARVLTAIQRVSAEGSPRLLLTAGHESQAFLHLVPPRKKSESVPVHSRHLNKKPSCHRDVITHLMSLLTPVAYIRKDKTPATVNSGLVCLVA